MPTPRPESETRSEWMERCIPEVLEDGVAEDEDQAVAVCSQMWEGGKSMPLERKSFPLADNEVKADVEKNRVEGYWATFGNRDHGGDVVHRGFFEETLQERMAMKGGIKVARNHEVLIGKPLELKEDEKGLWGVLEIVPTEGDLGGKNTLELIDAEVLTHGSITYSVRGPKGVGYEMETDEDGTVTRHLLKGNLFELGPVDFAMNDEAEIAGLKSLGSEALGILSEIPDLHSLVAATEHLTSERKDAILALAARLEKSAGSLREAIEQHDVSQSAAHDLLHSLRARRNIYGRAS